ncbi:MAG: GNAT family N-acetyltransferase, partial [Bacteroidetes bacterium]|nr:GNAT family N-acetyltransferase [Bacteroidota bacterium]
HHPEFMMNNIKIRPAAIDDTPVIIDFQMKMALESEGITLNHSILTEGVKAVFHDPSKGRYLVAEFRGRVIASLMLTSEWSDWNNKMVWW